MTLRSIVMSSAIAFASQIHALPLDWYVENNYEPIIEANLSCDEYGPWYCSNGIIMPEILACLHKGCIPDELETTITQIRTASRTGWVYPNNYRVYSGYGGSSFAFLGGGYGYSGANESSNYYNDITMFYNTNIVKKDLTLIFKKVVNITKTYEDDKEPNVVPLSASFPLLGVALFLLYWLGKSKRVKAYGYL